LEENRIDDLFLNLRRQWLRSHRGREGLRRRGRRAYVGYLYDGLVSIGMYADMYSSFATPKACHIVRLHAHGSRLAGEVFSLYESYGFIVL